MQIIKITLLLPNKGSARSVPSCVDHTKTPELWVVQDWDRENCESLDCWLSIAMSLTSSIQVPHIV